MTLAHETLEPKIEQTHEGANEQASSADLHTAVPGAGDGKYEAQTAASSPFEAGGYEAQAAARSPYGLASPLGALGIGPQRGGGRAKKKKEYDGSESIITAVGGQGSSRAKPGGVTYNKKHKRVLKSHISQRAKHLHTNMVKGVTTASFIEDKRERYETERSKYREHANRAYDAIDLMWTAHCATYTEAWENINTVLSTSALAQPAWATVLQEIGVAALFYGPVGSIATVIGAGGYLFPAAVKGIVAGASMKESGPLPAKNLLTTPGQTHLNGQTFIKNARNNLMGYVTELGDRQAELIDQVSPGRLLLGTAKVWSASQANSEAHVARLSTKTMEFRLWKTYLRSGGAKKAFAHSHHDTRLTKLHGTRIIPEVVLAYLNDTHSMDADQVYAWMGWVRPLVGVLEKSNRQKK